MILTIQTGQKEAVWSASIRWKDESSQLNHTKGKKKKKKTYGEHEYSICEIMRKEKEITASCPVYLKLQVIATVCVKCLVNMEVALNLYNKILWERDHIYLTSTTVYCYNYSILLLLLISRCA